MKFSDKWLRKTKEGRPLHHSNDMLLPVYLVNHIALSGTTENISDAKWWQEVGLAISFDQYNVGFLEALASLERKNHRETMRCVSNDKQLPEMINYPESFLAKEYPNDSFVF